MQIILKGDTDGSWIVHASNGDEQGRCGTIVQSMNNRRLKLDDGTTGFFNGEDCVAWDSGERWFRISVSGQQQHIMFRRPYVPVTFIVVYGIYHLAVTSWKRISLALW